MTDSSRLKIYTILKGPDFAYVFVGKIIQGVIVLLSLRVMTNFLSPSQLGQYFVFFTCVSMLTYILVNPVNQYVSRKAIGWNSDGTLLSVLNFYNFFLLLVSFLGFSLAFFLYEIGVGGLELPEEKLLIVLPFYLFFSSWFAILIWIINLLGYRKEVSVLGCLSSLLMLVLSCYFILTFLPTTFWWLVGLSISSLFMSVLAFVFLMSIRYKPSGNKTINPVEYSSAAKLIRFCYPIGIMTTLLWFQTSGYRFIVQLEFSIEYLAYLGIGMTVAAQIAALFEGVAMQYFYPVFYKDIDTDNKEQRREAVNNVINRLLPIYFFLAIFISCFSQEIVSVLVSKEYHAVYWILILAAWFEFFRMTCSLLSTISHSEMKTQSLVVPYFVGGLITFGGVSWSAGFSEGERLFPVILTISMFVSLLLMSLSMYKILKYKIDYLRIISVVLLASPLFLWFLVWGELGSFLYSVLVLSVFGIYFLYVCYFLLFKNWSR